MNVASKPDRIWMCSILFLDIVNYSSQSVQLQMGWKRRLNHYLARALEDVPEAERVILDTGDGAAICFLGGPDCAMVPALKLRSFFVGDEIGHRFPMRVRMGINLGPVRLVKDINGNLNALGDGINAGQRVMSFAANNQILVSRSFYEVVSCLADSYGQMFTFVGARKDKHDREHLVYELAPVGEAAPPPKALSMAAPTPPKESVRAVPPVPTAPPARTAPPVPTAPQGQLDPAVLDRLQALLAPLLGPMARYLVKDASRKHASLSDLCADLATHFDNKERAKFLEQCRQQLGMAVPVASSDAAQAPPAAEPASGMVWDPEMLEKAKRELAVHIGPMARFIVDSTASKARTLKDFYDALCREIPSSRDRERFLARCKASS